ncbi:RNA-binding protein 45-like isoform X2 [Pecten maximus]|uniref:RNA-binding protein 45-like isoform X2 n=1 Tax=Pecten maximus TaxID=6579 RepID=UPI001457F063|nr:RNA-binding protein 45-like isoform X2 [Pecten maximus]
MVILPKRKMAYKPYEKRHRDLQEDVRPPNSRLFVICGKGVKEETFKDAFEEYGTIEDIWVVKDKRTNEDKGVAYIKFSKSSEAAHAMEEMNGKQLEGSPKPIKVLIASSKREGSVRDPKEDEKLLRLFVIVPKSYTRDDLKKEFEKYGDVESATLVTDRVSGECKGFGYVRYHRAYHAALAMETCDPSFKPKFADPKPTKDDFDSHSRRDRGDRDRDNMYGGYQGGYRDMMGGGYNSRGDRGMKRGYQDMGMSRFEMGRSGNREEYGGGGGGGGSGGGYYQEPSRMQVPPSQPLLPMGSNTSQPGPMEMLQSYQSHGSTRLHITAPIGLTQGYLTRLFSLIPGLEYCDLNETTGVAYARYTTGQCASYARDKLDGFEYPIGSRLMVRFADGPSTAAPEPQQDMSGGYDSYRGYCAARPDQHKAEDMIQRAALILEKAGINPDRVLTGNSGAGIGAVGGDMERVAYTSIPLPYPQSMKPEDTEVVQRLFIVCQPSGIPEKVLRDAFCRFGNLIDVYLLPARNYGYAKFASKDSAMRAIQVLHGQNLAGNRLKVLEAEPPKNEHNDSTGDEEPKRPRY